MTSIHVLVAKLLRNAKRYDLPNETKACPSASVAWLKNVNRRNVDVTASRQFLSSIHHIAMNLLEISLKFGATYIAPDCHALHDELCQELEALQMCFSTHYKMEVNGT